VEVMIKGRSQFQHMFYVKSFAIRQRGRAHVSITDITRQI